MGGWDGRRSEVQVLARLSSSEKVFVLAHELTHAEMAIGYEEEAKTAGVKRVEDMEAVVHCACESWLRAMGVEGYWEFCCANGRTYLRREDLEVLYPLLASLSEAVSQGIGFELGMDGNSSLEA